MPEVRAVREVVDAQLTYEGAGFSVRRPFPGGVDASLTDPFLLLDHMGPTTYGPGDAKGAPDHPHRGFETVTYMLEGAFEHRDSTGGGGIIGPGDTQWMTAGAGLVHSEMPIDEIRRNGGTVHGIQLWVNLPRAEKLVPPRYQDIPRDRVAVVERDGIVLRVIAGELDGCVGPGSTHIPIVYAHATVQPGARLDVAWPRELNALVYVLSGNGRVGVDGRAVHEAQLAVLDTGERLVVDADDTLDVLLLGGRALREPVAWYGPFVMSTKQEILDAIDDFESGRMGHIAPKIA